MIKKFRNEGLADRLIRVFIAEIFIILALFWLSGVWQITAYIIGLILLITAISGFCALYNIFQINTRPKEGKKLKKTWRYLLLALVIIFPLVAGYYSDFTTKKIFLEDYNQMNNYYKQLLYNTGQGNRAESINNFYLLENEYNAFQNKYSNYKPFVIKDDRQFDQDLDRAARIISESKNEIYASGLNTEHVKLEEIRPIFQEILKRNGFSMLAVSLVDFHDSMEKVIEAADEKDAQTLITSYVEADTKLKSVEEEANDADIVAIRINLESLLNLAQTGNLEALPEQAAKLKSSFIKVYLQRG